MTQQFHDGKVILHAGDCLDVLDTLPDCSVDAVVCDPPYHLTSIVKRFGGTNAAPAKEGTDGAFKRASAGFMGKQWDGGDVAFQVETWRKVLRVLKPGGYVLAFASTRGFGRMSVALEDAGFITHPLIAWVFATGFPKATRIKAEGYDGFRYGGQALKPAIEPIYMGQKPFSEETGTANIMKWGTGAVNVDGCRIEGAKTPSPVGQFRGSDIGANGLRGWRDGSADNLGRWPANLVTDGSPEVVACFPNSDARDGADKGVKRQVNVFGAGWSEDPGASSERRDTGSAARFFASFPLQDCDRMFYSSKAGTDDRMGSGHPTIKPVALLQWLVRLVCPPGGVCLDPFAGTGTTAHACLLEGMRAVIIEREEEYRADIERRMGLVFAGPDEKRNALATAEPADTLPLFGGAGL